MTVIECAVPLDSALNREFVASAHFRDAYSVRLDRHNLEITDIFDAIFGHRPAWMKAILILRNKAAALAGLAVPTNAEILHTSNRGHYAVGDKIGPWPLYYLGSNELVAGRDNTHTDFRLSVMTSEQNGEARVTVSTICVVRNNCGRRYLVVITPFHKFGVRWLIRAAKGAGRI